MNERQKTAAFGPWVGRSDDEQYIGNGPAAEVTEEVEIRVRRALEAREINARQRDAAELRRLHVHAAQDEALMRQALEALKAENERLREALAAMVSWFPSADTYRRLGFAPSAPMEVLKEAKALLFKEDNTHEGS